jgi:DNA-directed RNA polymerase specialized sigma24 family protein
MPFPTTHRSVLERIRSADANERRLAFGDLAEAYWQPSRHYLKRQWQLTPEAAEDAAQAFFATAFEKEYFERYDPAKARFRTFLRMCLDRFVQNLQKAERAARRGGDAAHVPLDLVTVREDVDLDRVFYDELVRALFSRTVDDLRRAYAAEGKDRIFEVFERHDLTPAPETTYASLAAELDLPVTQVTNFLHAARRRFRDLALEQLRSITGSDDEFRAEARELFGIDVGR